MVLFLFLEPIIIHLYCVTKVCSLCTRTWNEQNFIFFQQQWNNLGSVSAEKSTLKFQIELLLSSAAVLWSLAAKDAHMPYSHLQPIFSFLQVLKQHGQDFLVGNKFSWADVQLMEAILAVEEKIPAVLSGFPQLQVILLLSMLYSGARGQSWSDHLSSMCKSHFCGQNFSLILFFNFFLGV